jgi:hypothetical protein
MIGTNASKRRFRGMGPREEDNDLLLLVVVSLICAALVGILEFGSTQPAVAAKPTVLASEEPVRVVLPFKPNIMPSER